jgi:hypothetical protein
MARKRKTVAEQRQEWDEAQERVWRTFRPRLDAATNVGEALAILASPVPEGRPGRRFYSNLGFFVQNLMVPNGATADERGLYLQLVRRMRDAGDMLPETCAKVERALIRSLGE